MGLVQPEEPTIEQQVRDQYRRFYVEQIPDIVQTAAMPWIGAPQALMRYYGRKTTQGGLLAKTINAITSTYREPFLGSGTIFRQLYEQGKLLGNAVLGEANPIMRNIYAQIRKNPKAIAEGVGEQIERYRGLDPNDARNLVIDTFDKLRAEGFKRNPAKEAISEIFVGQSVTGYNPPKTPLFKWSSNFVSPKGIAKRVESFGEALKSTDATILDDWKKVLKGAKRGDVAFIDPPYHRRKGYSVGWSESEELANELSKLSKRGVEGIVWNSPESLKFYKDFAMEPTGFMSNMPEYAANLGDLDFLRMIKR